MRARKKILYVITKSVWGGAQRYVFDLATHVSRELFEVAVAAGGNGTLFEKFAQARVRTIPIRHADRNMHAFKELQTFWELVKIFLREKPDIIHLNSSKMGVLGAIAAFFYRIHNGWSPAVIYTVHGWSFCEARPRWQKMLMYFSSWFSSLFQQKIIVINTADFYSAKKFISKKKLILIRNGIESFPYKERIDARKELRHGLGEHARAIGTIAELTKNKGLSFLVDAVYKMRYQLKDAQFSLCIIGEGEERAALEEKIISLGLRQIVHLHGFIPDAHCLLQGFDIFVLPSLKEGLPYTLMEAMDAGVPVVATAVGGVPDLITHNTSGILVQEKNAEALAGAILTLLHNKGQREKFSAQAQEHVRTNYRLCDMVKKTEALYKTI